MKLKHQACEWGKGAQTLVKLNLAVQIFIFGVSEINCMYSRTLLLGIIQYIVSMEVMLYVQVKSQCIFLHLKSGKAV